MKDHREKVHELDHHRDLVLGGEGIEQVPEPLHDGFVVERGLEALCG